MPSSVICTKLFLHTYIYIHIHIHTHIYIYAHICFTNIYMYVYIYIYIYIYIYKALVAFGQFIWHSLSNTPQGMNYHSESCWIWIWCTRLSSKILKENKNNATWLVFLCCFNFGGKIQEKVASIDWKRTIPAVITTLKNNTTYLKTELH